MRISECGFGIEIQKAKKVRNVDCGVKKTFLGHRCRVLVKGLGQVAE
jgi:hypothetical protein